MNKAFFVKYHQIKKGLQKALVPGFFLFIAASLIVIYGRGLHDPYLNWDDDINIFRNPYFLSGEWYWTWVRTYHGLFIPVTSSLWAALYNFASGEAWIFRLMNILIHFLNTVLVFNITQTAFRRHLDSNHGIAPFIAAILFSLHPLQVSAVAWISGGRDILALTFALLSLKIFFSSGTGRPVKIIFSILLFYLSLLSKPSLAALPLALLAFVFIFARHRIKEALLISSFWCLGVLGSAGLALKDQLVGLDWSPPFWFRPIVALDTLGFYLLKSFWPIQLAADYGRTPYSLFSNPSELLTTIPVFLGAFFFFVFISRKNKFFALSVLWPLLFLPVSGVVDFAYQTISTVADHYNYGPLAVLAVLVGAALSRLPKWTSVAAVVTFGVVGTWQSSLRADVWRSNESFFEKMLETNPRSFPALVNLAVNDCSNMNQPARGLERINNALKLDPEAPIAILGKIRCLIALERYEETMLIRKSLQNPRVMERFLRNQSYASSIMVNTALAFLRLGHLEAAWFYTCQGYQLSPTDEVAGLNLMNMAKFYEGQGVAKSCPPLESTEITLKRLSVTE